MLAAVVEKPGQFVVKEVETPTINSEQVLVKVHAASICNATDNHILHGIFDGFHDRYPQILGHEVCGEVVEIGEDVKGTLKLGQRIVMYTPWGAFCEYITFYPKQQTFAIVPENIPSKVATCCEMFDGAFLGTVYPARIVKDENVLIIGAGPMGLTTMAGAKVYAKTVSVVDLVQFRLDKAKEMGADYIYNHSEMTADEIVAAIAKTTGLVDVVIMCIAEDRSPNLDAFDMGAKALKYNGRMTSLVVAVKDIEKRYRLNPFLIISKDIQFKHSLNECHLDRNAIFQMAVDYVGEGKIKMEKVITHEICLDELPDALKMCDNDLDKVIKVIVYPKLSGK